MISPEGEIAMKACAEKAENETSFEVSAAQAEVLSLLKDGPKTGEWLVWECKSRGHVPHDDRAFGAVFSGLSVKGEIIKLSYGPRHKGHGTAGAIIWSLPIGD
jgi:hypothetical protein